MAHPEPALDPASQPWGKWLTTDHDSLKADVARNLVNNNNVLTQLNSSITNINRQLRTLNTQTAELLARVTYAEAEDITASFTGTQADNVPWGPTITFTITERRKVLIEHTAITTQYVYTQSGSINFAIGLLINGAVPAFTPNGTGSFYNFGSYATSGSAGAAVALRSTGSVRAYGVFILAPGSYTVRGNQMQRFVQTFSGGSSALNIASPALRIDVLGQV